MNDMRRIAELEDEINSLIKADNLHTKRLTHERDALRGFLREAYTYINASEGFRHHQRMSQTELADKISKALEVESDED